MRFLAAVAVVGLCLACCDAKAGGGGGPPPGDDCSAPIVIAGNGSFNYVQSGATNSFGVGESCGGNNDIWFLWNCPADGSYIFDTCGGASFDSLLGIFSPGCALSILGCNDDSCGANSQVEMPNLVGGEDYLIQISSFFPGSFTPFGVLTIGPGASTPPQGFGQAVPFVASNDGHGRVTFEVFCIPGTGPINNELNVVVDATSLGGGVFPLADDGANPDPFGGDLVFAGEMTVPLATAPGEYTVTFTVMDSLGRSGSGEFVAMVTDEPTPLNDECDTAAHIAGTGSFEYSVGLASTSPQPTSCSPMRSDIWFRWECLADGAYTFSTCDGYNSLDTVMEVYSDDCIEHPLIGCDDNHCGGGKGSAGQAEVTAEGFVAGQFYLVRIGVAPFAFVQQGTFNLNISTVEPSPPSGFGEATPFPVLSDGASSVTVTVFAFPGENPTSTDISVTLDGSLFGLGDIQLLDDGIAPDQFAGDLAFTAAFVMPSNVVTGFYFPSFTVADAELRSSSNTLTVQVLEPTGACCEGTSCLIRTANACASVAGSFLGHGVSCSPGQGYEITVGTSAFENIAGTGIRLLAIEGFDDAATSVVLPFSFPFYSTLQTSIFVSTNGFINFDGVGAASFVNQPIPTDSAPNGAFFCLWDDWVNDNGIFVETRGTAGVDRRFIVQWQNIRQFSGGGPRATFQLALFDSGRVEYRYSHLGLDQFADYSVGAESPAGDQGTSYPSIDLGTGNIPLNLDYVPGANACDSPSCPLDFNADGFVEPGDLDEFITAFFSDVPEENGRCDFNDDGFVEPGDLDEFITAYFEGGC